MWKLITAQDKSMKLKILIQNKRTISKIHTSILKIFILNAVMHNEEEEPVGDGWD